MPKKNMSRLIEEFTFYSVAGKKHKCVQHEELGPLNRREMLNLMHDTIDSGPTQVLRVSSSEAPKKSKQSSHPSKYRAKQR